MGIPVERYSKITDKNNREICLLRVLFPRNGRENAHFVIISKTTDMMKQL